MAALLESGIVILFVGRDNWEFLKIIMHKVFWQLSEPCRQKEKNMHF